jgi:hypothetical protein
MIIGEHFMPIRFQLMGLRGAKLENIKAAHSHIMGSGPVPQLPAFTRDRRQDELRHRRRRP